MVSSVSQKTSPGKVVKWNLPVSSPTMFSFEDFFLRAIFSPTARDISFLFSTIASDVLGIFYFTEVMIVSLCITKSDLQYVLCWIILGIRLNTSFRIIKKGIDLITGLSLFFVIFYPLSIYSL